MPYCVTDQDPGSRREEIIAPAAALLANFDGLVYRCRIDNNWTMEFLGGDCEGLTGYRTEDFIERGVLTYEELIHRDDRQAVRAQVEAALANRTRFLLEYRIVRRDGMVRWVSEHGSGIRNAAGQYVALHGYVQDITQRKESERALHEAERRFRSMFENAIEGIYQSAPGHGFLAVNPALAHMFGYDSPQQLTDAPPEARHRLYVHPDRWSEFVRLMHRHGQVLNFESEVRRRDGTTIWISENARAVRDEAGRILLFEGSVVDITERRRYEARIRHQATHDGLTGLPNRNYLFDWLQQGIRSAETGRVRLAVILLDLDQFKFVNDSLGHLAGDTLLKVIAQRLQAGLRNGDCIARQGGDEFVLVIRRCAAEGREPIEAAVRRTMALVADAVELDGAELQVTCSAGVSLYPDHGRDADSLLRYADTAMYKAKEGGSNCYAFFDLASNENAGERLALLTSMRHALAQNEFLLHFQPRISLSTGAIVGAEALIRWNHPARGMVAPAQFISLAEDSGLILSIGEWVLRRACEQNMDWQRAGLPPIPVSVNLSPRQLAQEDIVEVVADALEISGLKPKYLELEITETMVMRDVEQSLATLHRLKALGVAISIDDFGTGYSSLNYLKRFPVDTLKIDRSFVNDIATDRDDAAIVKAVISLGHILHLEVVAEGVETEAQRRFLIEYGCDQAQGYLFDRPLDPQEFENRWLSVAVDQITAP